eukprot:gene263-515_t
MYAGDRLTEKAYDNLTGGFCPQKTETNAKDRFDGKTVIVTGGAGNFGKSCAMRMASEGCNVALWDIADATPVAEEIKTKYKVQAQAFQLNVTDQAAVASTAQQVKDAFGKIDYLFNNAGYQGQFAKAESYNPDDFKKVMDINVNGVFYVLQAVANNRAKDGGGAIVNTSSMAAHSGPPNMIAYGSSKAAVLHMTKIAAMDWAPSNIRAGALAHSSSHQSLSLQALAQDLLPARRPAFATRQRTYAGGAFWVSFVISCTPFCTTTGVNSISPAFIGPGFMWTSQVELQAAAGSVYYDPDPNKVAQDMVNCTWLKRYGKIDEVIGPVAFLLSDDASYLTGVDIQITGGM